jgi:hypothetical protein
MTKKLDGDTCCPLSLCGDDTLRFRVQATHIEPRSEAQLTVAVTLLIKASESHQTELENTVQSALQGLVPATWVFAAQRREGESMGFERVRLDAMIRVPVSEVHNLKQRAHNASREGMELGTPDVSYRLPEGRINAIQSDLRLKVIAEVTAQQKVLANATGRPWRVGVIDFGTRKHEAEEGETRFSKGGYRSSAEEPFEGGGMAGAERFVLMADVTLKSHHGSGGHATCAISVTGDA